MKKLLIGVLTLFSVNCFADCSTVTDIAGYTSKEYNNYELKREKLEGTYQVNINGERSSVSGDDLSCVPMNKHSLFCYYHGNSRATAETWEIDPFYKTVTYTKTMNGWPYQLNGSTLMKGVVSGRCDM